MVAKNERKRRVKKNRMLLRLQTEQSGKLRRLNRVTRTFGNSRTPGLKEQLQAEASSGESTVIGGKNQLAKLACVVWIALDYVYLQCFGLYPLALCNNLLFTRDTESFVNS